MRDAKNLLPITPQPTGRNAARGSSTPEPDFSVEECVVGLECHVRMGKMWHTGKIVKVHSTDGGLRLYRFQSPKLYDLVTRAELRRRIT